MTVAGLVISDFLDIRNGGTATNITLSGGFETLEGLTYVTPYNGPQTEGPDIFKYGNNIIFDAGGRATDTGALLLGGAEQDVGAGGLATNTVISGGDSYVDAPLGPVINAGQFSYSGAIPPAEADNTIIYAGHQVVGNGTAVDAVVNGGNQDVDYLGTAIGTTVNSGGLENVTSGGKAEGTIVNSGGALFLFSGAQADYTIRSGGTLGIGPGYALGNYIVNETRLNVYGGSAGNVIVGSGGTLDLGNNASVGNLTVNPGATLDVEVVRFEQRRHQQRCPLVRNQHR